VAAHPQHFATKVSERRKRLGMTFLDVHRNGGPTAPTLAKAEAGALEDPRPSTLSKFDAGLRWISGSAASTYWDGNEPRPQEESRRRAVLEPAPGGVVLPLDRILALMTTQAELNDLISDRSEHTVQTGEIQPMVNGLNQHISAIVGLFVTDLLERNHTKDRGSIQPLLEYAFAELLSTPVSADDPERYEKLYRRWLVGKSDGIGSELETSFRRRFRRRNYPREGFDG
jgi:hypothetical protein